MSPLDHPLLVITQTPEELVVHCRVTLFRWAVLGGLVGGLFPLLVYTGMPKRASWVIRVTPLLAPLFVLWVFIFPSIDSHTLSMSRKSGMVEIVHRWAGIPYSIQHIPLANVERAKMYSEASGWRTEILLHDGSSISPFGKKPRTPTDQFVVTDGINELLGNHAKKSKEEDDPDADEVEREPKESPAPK